MSKGYIGVDLDGTIARYDGWKGASHIGAPLEPLVSQIKDGLARGIEYRIVTARVCSGNSAAAESRKAIAAWCLEVLGRELPMQAEKTYDMIRLLDDRASRVQFNTGRLAEDLLVESGLKLERRLDAAKELLAGTGMTKKEIEETLDGMVAKLPAFRVVDGVIQYDMDLVPAAGKLAAGNKEG